MKFTKIIVPLALIALLTAAGVTVRFASLKAADTSITAAEDINCTNEQQATVSTQPGSTGINGQSTGTTQNWVWPCADCMAVTEPYGLRFHPIENKSVFSYHISIGADEGATVCAAYGGTVSSVGADSEQGKFIVINDGNGIETIYRHLKTQQVSSGDTIAAGSIIGTVGSTGNVTGPFLEFAVYVNGEPTDPLSYYKN